MILAHDVGNPWSFPDFSRKSTPWICYFTKAKGAMLPNEFSLRMHDLHFALFYKTWILPKIKMYTLW